MNLITNTNLVMCALAGVALAWSSRTAQATKVYSFDNLELRLRAGGSIPPLHAIIARCL